MRSDSINSEVLPNSIPYKKIPQINLNVKKWDWHSLLSTIEEIESKIKLQSILSKNSSPSPWPTESLKNSREIRLNLSMLNWSRNFTAIKYALDHPSDDKNNLSS